MYSSGRLDELMVKHPALKGRGLTRVGTLDRDGDSEKRRADGGIGVPIMLVLAVIVALVLLVIGVGALGETKRRGEGVASGFSVTESAAYAQLKAKCNLWSSSAGSGFSGSSLSIQCEEEATVDSCLDVFLDNTFKAYSAMYYAKVARLDQSVYYRAASSTKTAACISAAEELAPGVFREDDAQAALILWNALDKIYTDPTTGGGVSLTGKERVLVIARNCAALCEWVNTRSDVCTKGGEECANLVIAFDEGTDPELLP
ncbi:MAG: hypothetical protein V1820_01190 [archaeon]